MRGEEKRRQCNRDHAGFVQDCSVGATQAAWNAIVGNREVNRADNLMPKGVCLSGRDNNRRESGVGERRRGD